MTSIEEGKGKTRHLDKVSPQDSVFGCFVRLVELLHELLDASTATTTSSTRSTTKTVQYYDRLSWWTNSKTRDTERSSKDEERSAKENVQNKA